MKLEVHEESVMRPESVRCPSCNLVQFKSEKCRRCKTSLVFQVLKEEQPEIPRESVDRSRDFQKCIGANVRRLRKQKSMTQDNVVERTGMKRTYMSKVENGRLEPTLNSLFRLADALEVDVIELFSSERELMTERLLADPFIAEAARLTEAQQVQVLGFARQLAGAK